uniref:Uncharacterized protein n=1 Tax=Candidatus Kentrum sp. FW TaxID=2126338 RepID=A0A450SI47_9GAMM|nr:MAG: hypothetical protein BECKFW1821A_GA0114235_103919 [Candidatus Kentron sp. FW]
MKFNGFFPAHPIGNGIFTISNAAIPIGNTAKRIGIVALPIGPRPLDFARGPILLFFRSPSEVEPVGWAKAPSAVPIIGANGAGKSNFLSLFPLMANLVGQRLQLFVQQGGADALLHFGRKRTERIHRHAALHMPGHPFALAHRIVAGHHPHR